MADFGSESVAAFRRNGWPTCVGISGRLGSEYAGGQAFVENMNIELRLALELPHGVEADKVVVEAVEKPTDDGIFGS